MTSALKLNLGCGSTVVPGWVNIDKSPTIVLARVPGFRRSLAAAGLLSSDQATSVFPRGVVRADVRRGLRYGDRSVGFVYSSHLIEHMARWQALGLLRECVRVLEPGGRLRVVTPDLAQVVDSYRHGNRGNGRTAADTFMENLGTFVEQPGRRLATVLQRLFTAPHQWLYDAESLEQLLFEAGFEEVTFRGFRESELPDIELLEHRTGLNAEARRA